MNLETRARIHAAMGDPHRLAMIEHLRAGDRSVAELGEAAGVQGNLAAHHLDALEAAGLIERRTSEGDHRRRYVTLRVDRLAILLPAVAAPSGPILFVCTHNSARSQFAAALWRERTGGAVDSAGTEPASRVHPSAVAVARDWGLDLRAATPKGYDELDTMPGLVISVCDRAREAGLPFVAPSLHWSIPDPVLDGRPESFRAAFATIVERLERLAPSTT